MYLIAWCKVKKKIIYICVFKFYFENQQFYMFIIFFYFYLNHLESIIGINGM